MIIALELRVVGIDRLQLHHGLHLVNVAVGVLGAAPEGVASLLEVTHDAEGIRDLDLVVLYVRFFVV